MPKATGFVFVHVNLLFDLDHEAPFRDKFFVLQSLTIRDCHVDPNNVPGIIEAKGCSDSLILVGLEIQNVKFVNNTNLGGSATLYLKSTEDFACYTYLFMERITFLSNYGKNIASLAYVNIIRHMQLKDNHIFNCGDETSAILVFPQILSITKMSHVHATENGCRLITLTLSFFKIKRSVFENTTSEVHGVIFGYFSLVTVSNSEFRNNVVNGTGGAISCKNCFLVKAKYSNFTENKAEYGGAISVDNGKVRTRHVRFERNKAIAGGAIYVKQREWIAEFLQTEFERNTATEVGGGIYGVVDENNGIILNEALFRNNRASFGGRVFVFEILSY